MGNEQHNDHQLTTSTDSSKQTDVILVPVDSSDVPGADPSAILDYTRKGWEGPDPVRSTLLKFIAPAFGGDATGIKQYLAVVCILSLSFNFSLCCYYHACFVGLGW